MKRAIKKQSSLYAFLEPSLASGDEQAIFQARKEYWKQYKANWKKQKRATQKTVEISFTQSEWKVIKEAAEKHNRSNAAFIKKAAQAYCSKEYLVPNQLEYNKVYEALCMLYAKLKNIESSTTVSSYVMNELLHSFITIEKTITQHLQNPQTLEEKITETIQANPGYKTIIYHLLEKN